MIVDKFEIELLEDAREFLRTLDKKARYKIIFNIDKSKKVNDPELFKKLDNEIWEFRIKYQKQQLRLLGFWDKRNSENILVICTHGFIKKTQKVTKQEIEKAKRLMKLYFETY
ncbi:MAG TPA: type II toxin-antitoxin system RelE/ParE family toxin [Salinivirgaceae bacterium]|jgi:phage-related protein|nr:type II toxin-antitoxin system RelE/ParE family toxin [Salinivirgaceae bacterium]